MKTKFSNFDFCDQFIGSPIASIFIVQTPCLMIIINKIKHLGYILAKHLLKTNVYFGVMLVFLFLDIFSDFPGVSHLVDCHPY